MIRAGLLWFLVLSLSSLCGQVTARFQNSFEIPEAEKMDVDQYGAYYLVLDNRLQKIDPYAKKELNYSNMLLGSISEIDALNPMAPLLFYEEVNTLVLLDNRLNESQSLNLLDLGLSDPQQVVYSDREHLWVYDQSRDQLLRFHLKRERIVSRSVNITQVAQLESKPSALFSSFDRVILYAPEVGALVFDSQGSFSRQLKIPPGSQLAYHNYRLVSVDPKGKLLLFDLKRGTREQGLLPEKAIRDLALQDDDLHLLFQNEIKVYKLSW